MSKNIFKEHIPGFVDRDPEPPYHFDTLEELLEQPQVKRFTSWKSFKYLSQSLSDGQICLMATDEDGSYGVVGYLEYPIEGLKEWHPPSRDIQT